MEKKREKQRKWRRTINNVDKSSEDGLIYVSGKIDDRLDDIYIYIYIYIYICTGLKSPEKGHIIIDIYTDRSIDR